MGIIAACATFMMIMSSTIPVIMWFDKDACGSMSHGNDAIKKITTMCLGMLIIATGVFSWAMYHVVYPIKDGTYTSTSSYNRNSKHISTVKECTKIVFGTDPCYIIKTVTTPYKTVYGEPIIETFGE